jgi:sarcosine oxidase subunit alpha
VQRETRVARTAIGVLDASTLGKIDIRGPDAREFLNRVYTNAWTKLAPGKARYGLMLGEDGMVMDDGVTTCFADDHFHMTTTTGGAARVLSKLEGYLQTEWPDLRVYLTTVTEQWAVASIAGPECHRLVTDLCDDLDADPQSFEFMTWREAHIGGIPVRVFRISFTGELSYEINIPATYGLWLWEQVMAKGAQYGVTPYGTEACTSCGPRRASSLSARRRTAPSLPRTLASAGWSRSPATSLAAARCSAPTRCGRTASSSLACLPTIRRSSSLKART